ncbi:TPA: O-antigen translocase [Kluyvera georgiana]
MTMIKTSILGFIATLIKMISGLVINKAISLYVGPAGLALIGQFQNFSQLAMTAAQGAINTGVTKYTAEYGKDREKMAVLFSTAAKISLISSIVVGGGIIILSKYASIYFFETIRYEYVFVIFGFTIVLFVINNLLLSIINGLREIKAWIIINIIQSVYSLIFTTLLIFLLGIDGALIALVTNQSVILFVVLWIIRKHKLLNLAIFRERFSHSEAKKLSSFALMTIITLASGPTSLVLVRNFITKMEGLEVAGYWQAIWSLSTMALLLFMTVIKIYFLPRLSEVEDKSLLRKELINGITLFTLIASMGSFIIYVERVWIVKFLFSKDFLPMVNLFFWQILGSILKVIGTFFGILLSAKAKNMRVIFVNVIFSFLYVILTYYFYDKMKLEGVVFAFFVTNACFLIFVLVLSWDLLYGQSRHSNINI